MQPSRGLPLAAVFAFLENVIDDHRSGSVEHWPRPVQRAALRSRLVGLSGAYSNVKRLLLTLVALPSASGFVDVTSLYHSLTCRWALSVPCLNRGFQMIGKRLLGTTVLLTGVLTCCPILLSQTLADSAQAVSFCKLSREPDTYKGKLITLRVRVQTFRHGTLISDPSCPKHLIGLISKQSAGEATSLSRFFQFLQERRRSTTPIFATVTGRLVAGAADGFVKQDVVFNLESVAEVSEGDQPTKP